MDKATERELSFAARHAARHEVKAFAAAVRAMEDHQFCAVPDMNVHRRDALYQVKLQHEPALHPAHNELVKQHLAAHNALETKIGQFLSARGVNVAAPKTQQDEASGFHLKIDIVDGIEARTIAARNLDYVNGKLPKGCVR